LREDPALTATRPPDLVRPRYQIAIDPGLVAFVEANSGPGAVFASAGHATELAIGRMQDEMEFLAAWCKEESQPFRREAYWRIHADAIAAYRAPAMGPRPTDAPTKTVVGLFLHDSIRDWILAQQERFQVWNATRPLPHAIDTALRILQEAGLGPLRSTGFAFDEAAFLRRYRAAAKA